MKEIELKVHVQDKQKLIQKLNQIATYKGTVNKEDVYYKKQKTSTYSSEATIRLRTETFPEEQKSANFLLTYKQKEQKISKDGISFEVNEEQECKMSSFEPLESFLKNSGFEIFVKKHKEVKDWTLNGATLELCNVEPLGDFLEIEILSSKSDEKTLTECFKTLENILYLLEIPKDKIESRYYSEMILDSSVKLVNKKNQSVVEPGRNLI